MVAGGGGDGGGGAILPAVISGVSHCFYAAKIHEFLFRRSNATGKGINIEYPPIE